MGILFVSQEAIEDDMLYQPLIDIGFVPFEVSQQLDGKFKYTGTSPQFEILHEGDAIPVYTMRFHLIRTAKTRGYI